MSSSFRDRQVAAEYEGSNMPCRTCRSLTDHETLCNLGGMCHACFQHYCDPEPRRGPPLTLDEKRALIAKMRGLVATK